MSADSRVAVGKAFIGSLTPALLSLFFEK